MIVSGFMSVGLFCAGFYKQIIQGQEFGSNPMSDSGMIIGFILDLILFTSLFLLFGFAKLTMVIDDKGITYRFFPFHFKNRLILWDEIMRYEVIKYNPILDYGGWGVRIGGRGKAYNVSGNMGLLLYLKSGRPLLIGTQKSKELIDFLSKLK